MALNATRLANAIYTAWTTASGSGLSSPLSSQQQAILMAQCTAIATAVVVEITGFAVVSTTDAGTATGAMTGGPGGPGVAVGTGTVS